MDLGLIWQILFWVGIFVFIMFMGAGIIFMIYYFSFNFLIEMNTPTGNNFIDVKTYKAKKVKRDGFTEYKLFMRKETIMSPEDLRNIYRRGKKWIIRLYKSSETEFHPISLSLAMKKLKYRKHYKTDRMWFDAHYENITFDYDNGLTNMKDYIRRRDELSVKYEIVPAGEVPLDTNFDIRYKPIPQNSLLWMINKLEKIPQKYGKQSKLMEFAPIISLGIIGVVFILTIIFTIEFLNTQTPLIVSSAESYGRYIVEAAKTCQLQNVPGVE